MRNPVEQAQPELGIWKPAQRAGILATPIHSKALRPGMGVCSHYDYVLNAYHGCGHACEFCYAASFVADETLKENWGNWVKYKENALSEVKKSLNLLRGKRILMSSATDPYQPLEIEIALTRRILETFLLLPEKDRPYIQIITRSPHVTRDIDLLSQFPKKAVTISITTDDDNIRKQLEPFAPSIQTRWKTLQKLKYANIPIRINLCPLIDLKDPEKTAQIIHQLQPQRLLWDLPHNREGKNNGFVGTTPPRGWAALEAIGWTEKTSLLAIANLRHHLLNLRQQLPKQFQL